MRHPSLTDQPQKFYLGVRLSVVHPLAVSFSRNRDGASFQFPETREQWLANPSRKLDALAEICLYHLKNQNAPPLKVNSDNVLVPSDIPVAPRTLPGANTPDKIVIFSAFTQHLPLIVNVSLQFGPGRSR